MPDERDLTLAILPSTEVFEQFYGSLDVTFEDYLSTYRNDWSWYYAKALADKRTRVVLYMSTLSRSGFQLTPDGYEVRFLRVGVAYRAFSKLPGRQRFLFLRWVSGLVNGLALSGALKRAVTTDAVDLLLVQEYWTGRFDVLARSALPVVAMDQGIRDNNEIRWLKRGAMRRARGLTVLSEVEERKVRALGAGNVAKLTNVVDTDFFARTSRARHKSLLFVGRLYDDQKRVSLLLQALGLLEESWTLDIFGDGESREHLEGLARELALTSRVHFHGFATDRERLREAYQTAGVFVVPSAFEGLPVVLLEAMSCGMACVVTAIPSLADTIHTGVNGIVVDIDLQPRALADGIVQAWALKDALGAAAHATVLSGHSYSSFAADYKAFLRTCIPDADRRHD